MTEKYMFLYTVEVYFEHEEKTVTESGLLYADDLMDATSQISHFYGKTNIEKLQIDCYADAPLVFNATDEKEVLEKILNRY